MKIRKFLMAIFLSFVVFFIVKDNMSVSLAQKNNMKEITYFENIRFSVDEDIVNSNDLTFSREVFKADLPKGVLNSTIDAMACSDKENNYAYEFRAFKKSFSFVGANTDEELALILSKNVGLRNYENMEYEKDFYLFNDYSISDVSHKLDEEFGCEILAKITVLDAYGNTLDGYIKVIEPFDSNYYYIYIVAYSKDNDISNSQVKKIVSSLTYDNSYKGTLLDENSAYVVTEDYFGDYPVSIYTPTFSNLNVISYRYSLEGSEKLANGSDKVFLLENLYFAFCSPLELGTITDKNGNTWEKYKFSNNIYYFMTDTINNRVIIYKIIDEELYDTEKYADIFISNLNFTQPFESMSISNSGEECEFYNFLLSYTSGSCPRRAFLMNTPFFSTYFSREENKPLYDSIYNDIYINKIFNENYEEQEAVATTEEIIEPTTEAVVEPIATPTDVVVPETTETPNTEAQTPVETPTTEIIEQENTSSEAESESVSK